MNLLFLCKYNRFRSKVAEAIFLKLNKDKGIEVKSAGVLIDLMRQYVAQSVIKELKRRGYAIRDEQSRRVDDYLLLWADKIIIVANNVHIDLFKKYKNKIDIWKIEDADEKEEGAIKRIIGEIEKRVKGLIKTINRE